MATLRAAVVGAGLMGRWHAYYATRAGAEVVAIVDRSAPAAALRSRCPRAEVFPDLGQCLASCPVDVVHVCTGLDSHAPLAETALRAGKHVLVEKPLAPSAAEVERLLRVARESGMGLGVVHQFPHQRGFRQLLRKKDRLGDLVQVTHHICSAGGEGRTAAERRRILLEILPHPFSLFWSLLGGEASRLAWDVARFSDDELTLGGQQNGTQLLVLLSLRGRPPCNELTVVGTGGTAHVDLFHGYHVLDAGTVSRAAKILLPFAHGVRLLAGAGWNLAGRGLRREPAYPGLFERIRSFYQSILAGKPAADEAEELLAIARWIDQVRLCSPDGARESAFCHV